MLNYGDYNSFSDLFSGYLNIFNHLNMKLLIFVGILQVSKFESLKFRILEILNFHPCEGSAHNLDLSATVWLCMFVWTANLRYDMYLNIQIPQ